MRKKMNFIIIALATAFVAGFLLSAAGVTAAPFSRRRYVQIVAEVFLDTAGYNRVTGCPGCDGFWDNSDWCGELHTPLPPMTVTLRDGETQEEIAQTVARKNYSNGRAWAYFSVPARESFILEIDEDEIPDGFVSCPTSLLSRVITSRKLQHGRRLERFYFWWGCPPTPPADDTPPEEPPPPPPPPDTGTDYYYGCRPYPIYGYLQ